MITKDELRKLLTSNVEYLSSLGLANEEILEILKIMKDLAVLNGIYKDEILEGNK